MKLKIDFGDDSPAMFVWEPGDDPDGVAPGEVHDVPDDLANAYLATRRAFWAAEREVAEHLGRQLP